MTISKYHQQTIHMQANHMAILLLVKSTTKGDNQQYPISVVTMRKGFQVWQTILEASTKAPSSNIAKSSFGNVDSGAPDNVTPDLTNLNVIYQTPTKQGVIIANGKFLHLKYWFFFYILQCQLVLFVFIIFFMPLKSKRIRYLSIIYAQIMMFMSILTKMLFLLRISTQIGTWLLQEYKMGYKKQIKKTTRFWNLTLVKGRCLYF